MTVRVFPLRETAARLVCREAMVMKGSSLMRMPVAQMVCMIRHRRRFPRRLAASTRRTYSALVSSWSLERKTAVCIRKVRTAQSGQPAKRRKLFMAVSMELALDRA